jgi:hypothetical protein
MFVRHGSYWEAKGWGVPPDEAERLHERYGRELRINGDTNCLSPKKARNGFAVDYYHVVSQEALNALAATIVAISERASAALEAEEQALSQT